MALALAMFRSLWVAAWRLVSDEVDCACTGSSVAVVFVAGSATSASVPLFVSSQQTRQVSESCQPVEFDSPEVATFRPNRAIAASIGATAGVACGGQANRASTALADSGASTWVAPGVSVADDSSDAGSTGASALES